MLTEPPDLAAATGQTQCAVRRSADKPLIVEWPAAERAALESLTDSGVVAVRYAGCEMELLPACRTGLTYDRAVVALKRERVVIADTDELYAKLPIGAASLEGRLAREGSLVVDMTVTGRLESPGRVLDRGELSGDCAGATHLVTGVTLGAFTLASGAAVEAGLEGDVRVAKAGASVGRHRELIASDGDPVACEPGAADPEQCRALLRIEVVPLAGTPYAAPGPGLAPSFTPTASDVASRRIRPPTVDREDRYHAGALSAYILGGTAGVGLLASTVVTIAQSAKIGRDLDHRDEAQSQLDFELQSGLPSQSAIESYGNQIDHLDAEIAQTRHDRRLAGIATASLGGATAVLLGVGIALRRSERRLAARRSAARLQLAPTLGGVVLSGRF